MPARSGIIRLPRGVQKPRRPGRVNPPNDLELEAARNGTYLADNYNDVPSSFQRARELAVRIDETRATLDESQQKQTNLATQLTAERERLRARSSVALSVPIDGNLWTVQAAAGEFVRKGQQLFTVLDCATVVV